MMLTRRHNLNICNQFLPNEFRRAFRYLKCSVATVLTSIAATLCAFDFRWMLRTDYVSTFSDT